MTVQPGPLGSTGQCHTMPVRPDRQLFRERLWTPPGRDRRQLRNARLKVLGSAILLVILVAGAVGLLI